MGQMARNCQAVRIKADVPVENQPNTMEATMPKAARLMIATVAAPRRLDARPLRWCPRIASSLLTTNRSPVNDRAAV